ncbi:MAG: hypothetical protein V7672_01125 [Brevundimonas sp.]|uniref:hypothetical protein n=1 Tax=Brevundimonas sp. TaxID=1871086 RepID=UPI003002C30F
MTNVSATAEKLATRKGLFAFAIKSLEREGWVVSRIPKAGKASLRQISRNGERKTVSIRTSQDTWIAFPRAAGDDNWVTLDVVDYVVAASVNDKHDPTEARVHMIPGEVARDHWDRAYEARTAAGFSIPVGRGIWLALYAEETAEPVSLVGAGLGLKYPPIGKCDLSSEPLLVDDADTVAPDQEDSAIVSPRVEFLTISEAKKRLSVSLGVPESAIKITVEH